MMSYFSTKVSRDKLKTQTRLAGAGRAKLNRLFEEILHMSANGTTDPIFRQETVRLITEYQQTKMQG